MPIERNLQAKGRMAAHLNSEVSPLGVENMKMVMVDEPPVFRPSQHYFTVAIIFGLPNQGRSFGNENGKHPSELGIGGAKFLGLGVLGFIADRKIPERDFVFARIGVHAPGKVPPPPWPTLLAPPGGWEEAGSPQSQVTP